MNEREYKFGISRINGVGTKTYQKIIEYFGGAKDFWDATEKNIRTCLGDNLGKKVYRKRNVIDIQNEISKLKKLDIEFTVLGSTDYPFRLSQIDDPPIVLYFRGNSDLNILNKSLTIVGTRSSTEYGKDFLRLLIPRFIKENYTIISGLAFGIDAIAHRYTLSYKGKTAAVIADSAHRPIPKTHTNLYEEILNSGGLIVSEQHPDSEFVSGKLPRRNRILAGLSAATLVVEAPKRSGALITGHLAFDYNRQVFALPGSINKGTSRGCNHLIKINRAKLVENADDILIEIENNYQEDGGSKELNLEDLSSVERKILDIIYKEPKSLTNLKKIIDMDTSELLASLMKLEIKGLVKKDDFDKYYVLI